MKRDYLLDDNFLTQIDNDRNRVVYVKLISLDFDENPQDEIIGRITSGSINVDGASAVRRTCSLSLVANDLNMNEYYWGLKTKFRCFIGLENKINTEYPNPIWFPMGSYVLTSFSCNQALAQYSISVSGKDKMTLLNGDLGGVITAYSVDFGQMTEQQKDGSLVKSKLLIRNIIREGVREYAHEPYRNIIINDLDDEALELLEYRGTEPFYVPVSHMTGEVGNMTLDGGTVLYKHTGVNSSQSVTIGSLLDEEYDKRIELGLNKSNEPLKLYPTEEMAKVGDDNYETIIKVQTGDVIGYRTTTLTYAGDLIANVGETFTSVLDKIKTMLGDYEYFYDLDGNFIWQRRPTYVNVSWNTIVQNEDEEKFADNAMYNTSVTYSFENSRLVTAIQNNPATEGIKNDYSIFGIRKTSSGVEVPVHIRYAIDEKPIKYRSWDGLIYATGALTEEEIIEAAKDLSKELFEEGLYQYAKRPLPAGLSDDWWDVWDWGEYYKRLTGDYPSGTMSSYATDAMYIDLNEIFTALPLYDENGQRSHFPVRIQSTGGEIMPYSWSVSRPCFLFDTLIIGDTEYLSYIGHNPSREGGQHSSCGHHYDAYFMQKYRDVETYNITHPDEPNVEFHAYFYKPQLPAGIVDYYAEIIEQVAKEIAVVDVDWREIIWRMADDYMKHSMCDPKYELNPNNFEKIEPEDLDSTLIPLGGYYTRKDKYTLANKYYKATTYYTFDKDNNSYIRVTDELTPQNFKYNEIELGERVLYYIKEVTPDYVETREYDSSKIYYKYIDYEERLRQYNPDTCADGRTGYEQYYTDIKSFWREIYNPDSAENFSSVYMTASELKEHGEDYFWFKNQEQEFYKNDTVYYTVDLYGKYQAHSVNKVKQIDFENHPDYYYLPVQCGGNWYDPVIVNSDNYKKNTYYVKTAEYLTFVNSVLEDIKQKEVQYEADIKDETKTAEEREEATNKLTQAKLDERQQDTIVRRVQRVKDDFMLCFEEEYDSTHFTGYYEKNEEQAFMPGRGYYKHTEPAYYPQYESEGVEYPNKYWSKSIWRTPEKLNFWFDFLDNDGELSKYSIKRIGHRPKTENNNNIKAVYYRETPNIIFVNSEEERLKVQKTKPGYTILTLKDNIEHLFTISSQGQSCKDKLNSMLYDNAICKETITLTTIPIYYLQPNTRIFVTDLKSGINGEYIISRLGYNLTYNGTLSITATKAAGRIY